MAAAELPIPQTDIQIHPALNAIHRAVAAVLPHVVVVLEAGGLPVGSVVGQPEGVVGKLGELQVFSHLGGTAVGHGGVAGVRDDAAELLGAGGNDIAGGVLGAGVGLTDPFPVKDHGICNVVVLNPGQGLESLFPGLLHTGGLGEEVDSHIQTHTKGLVDVVFVVDTPMGLEIKRNSLVIGENLGKVYGAVRYPQKVDMGWLSKITNIPSTIVSVGITPIDNGSLISAISKSIVQQRGAADSAKDPLTRQRAEKAAEDGERIMQRIDQEGETVAMMSLTVMPIAQDEANFTKVCRRVESAFNIQKCKVRTLANLQKEGFQSISPTYPANSTVDSIVSRIIPMSTFVGGFPFASSGYNDGRGYYFAKDSNGGLVILDTWERGNDRTNSSFVIMGVAGIGKSTVVKHIMLSEYMKGTKILCIDPESEYKDMCRNLNGSWLNAGGGKNGRSNLLQIRPAPRDDDDETDKLYTDEGNGMSDMALHMKTLEIEFSLYLPSLTDMQKAILKQTIIELYNQFGIFWETDIRQLKATDFPILSDLHALLEKKAEANKENPV